MAAPHSTDPPALREAKALLRRAMRTARLAGSDADLIAALFDHVRLPPGTVVAGVWPMAGEPDLRPLWHRLHANGIAVVLPHTPPLGEALHFRPWHPGCTMQVGRFGTLHPQTEEFHRAPDLLFVPLLAFDRQGYRLGAGGGYYDRTLAALPLARAIGYGFSAQQVEAVPRGAFDRRLDEIVTERGRATIER